MFLPQLTRYLDIKKLKGKYIQIRNSGLQWDWWALYWWSPLPCWHISCQAGQINMESEALLCLGQASTGSRKADSNFIAIISKIFIRSDIFSSRDTRLSIPSCKCPAGCGVRVCDVHWVSSLAQLRAWWLLTGGWPWTESSHPLTLTSPTTGLGETQLQSVRTHQTHQSWHTTSVTLTWDKCTLHCECNVKDHHLMTDIWLAVIQDSISLTWTALTSELWESECRWWRVR